MLAGDFHSGRYSPIRGFSCEGELLGDLYQMHCFTGASQKASLAHGGKS